MYRVGQNIEMKRFFIELVMIISFKKPRKLYLDL